MSLPPARRKKKKNANAIGRLQYNLRLQAQVRFDVGSRHDFKALQDPHNRVADLGRGELLAQTDAGTDAEGDVVPRRRLPVEPSVRVECERGGVRRVEIVAPVQVDG